MHTNHLKQETSPYLLQHAHQPVHWMPWGEEAFRRAQEENRPVFLSVGYSSCHWCHVMAHESFDDEEVADLLNRSFVCVKVDREEWPAVDALYMLATQILTERGGWPNSVFLLPDQRPFYAGTYWPKEDRGGYMGFRSLVQKLADLWGNQRTEVERQAASIAERMRALSVPMPAPAEPPDPLPRWLEALRHSWDGENGGFGGAPKFPPHSTLTTLLGLPADTERTVWIRGTLDAMALGGIRDQIGGAFHRYATDAEWFLPHFEVMLADNAQLAGIYARAARQLDVPVYAEVAREICQAMLRDFWLPEGGFATAWDADSEEGEGDYYLWSYAEMAEVLGERAEVFASAFGLLPQGNAHDEATGRPLGKNILHPRRFPDAGLKEDMTKLLAHRRRTRTPPMRDDKVLTGWNALMIRGLVTAGKALEIPEWVAVARETAEQLAAWNRDGMRRSFCRGQVGPPAVLEDYVFMADAWLALLEPQRARALMQEVEQRFRSPEGGYTLAPKDGMALWMPQQDPFDQATPSAIGMAVKVWTELGEGAKAHRLRKVYAGAVAHSAHATQGIWRGM
jgi:uncharacterized protein YyaL (SSP411 family)